MDFGEMLKVFNAIDCVFFGTVTKFIARNDSEAAISQPASS